MKKKYPEKATKKDKKDWLTFTKQIGNLYDKDSYLIKKNTSLDSIKKLDLHGVSLNDANKIVKKFIIQSFEEGYRKLLIITGKGLRSKADHNPYVSKNMSVLKYSIPEFIKNDENLSKKISKTSKADLKDGGEGAFYVFLKKERTTE